MLSDVKKVSIHMSIYMFIWAVVICCCIIVYFPFYWKFYFLPAPTWEKKWALNSNQTTHPLTPLAYVSLNILKMKPPHLRVSSYTLLELSILFRNEVNWTLNIQLNWTLSFRTVKQSQPRSKLVLASKWEPERVKSLSSVHNTHSGLPSQSL